MLSTVKNQSAPKTTRRKPGGKAPKQSSATATVHTISERRRSLEEARDILRAVLIDGCPGHESGIDELASRDRRGLAPVLSLALAEGLLATVRDGLPLDEENPPSWLRHMLNVMEREWELHPEKEAAWRGSERYVKIGGLTFIATFALMAERQLLDAEEAEIQKPSPARKSRRAA